MDNVTSNTRQKALALNLDATTYGTFAEIGAGQGSGPLVLFRRRRGWNSGEDHFGLRHGSQQRALRTDPTLCQPAATGVDA